MGGEMQRPRPRSQPVRRRLALGHGAESATHGYETHGYETHGCETHNCETHGYEKLSLSPEPRG